MHIDRLVLTVALFGIVLNCCASSCSEKVPYSRKAHGCPGEYSNVYPVLVTSLGGAGTHHITCVLDALNISVGHEHLDRDGSVVRCRSVMSPAWIFMSFLIHDL